jgi:hypothetical protein
MCQSTAIIIPAAMIVIKELDLTVHYLGQYFKSRASQPISVLYILVVQVCFDEYLPFVRHVIREFLMDSIQCILFRSLQLTYTKASLRVRSAASYSTAPAMLL